MNPATAQLIIQLLPVVIELTDKVYQAAKEAKEAGYDIPTIDKLKEQTDKIRSLPDL